MRNVEVLENISNHYRLLRCCIVPKQYLPARVNQRINYSSIKNSRFVFTTTVIKPELHSIAGWLYSVNEGHVEDVHPAPSPEQRAIASVLGLDDKIDLLTTRQNPRSHGRNAVQAVFVERQIQMKLQRDSMYKIRDNAKVEFRDYEIMSVLNISRKCIALTSWGSQTA